MDKLNEQPLECGICLEKVHEKNDARYGLLCTSSDARVGAVANPGLSPGRGG